MVPDVQVPTYDQAYGSLSSVYDPQVQLVQQEQAQLPGQQQTVLSSLDQAKVNAFRDITNSANAKGMLFSGFTPNQEATYIGTKYLPAVANAKTSFQNQANTLQDKINQINAQRASQAQGIVSSATTAAQNAAYKNAQLAISAQKASTNSKASTVAANQSAAQAINDALKKSNQIGRDGYLSPYTYNDALSAWVQDGLSKSDFTSIFGHYQNPTTKGYQK